MNQVRTKTPLSMEVCHILIQHTNGFSVNRNQPNNHFHQMVDSYRGSKNLLGEFLSDGIRGFHILSVVKREINRTIYFVSNQPFTDDKPIDFLSVFSKILTLSLVKILPIFVV